MKAILITIFLILLLHLQAKTVHKTLVLNQFYQEGPFIFLTKFYLGRGTSRMDIKYNKGDQIVSELFYQDIGIGMISQNKFEQFSNGDNYQAKFSMMESKQKFNFRQERNGMKHMKIFDLQQQQLYFFYIYSCKGDLPEVINSNQQINIEFSVLNKNSHFGQYQYSAHGYIIIIILWLCLVFRFMLSMADIFTANNPDWLKTLSFIGLILLGAAYIYKLLQIFLVYYDGAGFKIFQILYFLFKHVGEALITTLMLSLSWGWTITNMNSNNRYLITGLIVGIINILGLSLCQLSQEEEGIYHYYDTKAGFIILIIRILIFFLYFIGMNKSNRQANGNTKIFLKKLNVIGSCYLLSWPITVIVVEMTLPNFLHKQIITFVEQFVHIISCTMLCHMISDPQSDYRRLSLHEDDNPLGMASYRHK